MSDKDKINQEEVKGVLELGDVTVAVAGLDTVWPSDVSYPQKKNRKGWKST